MDHVAKVFYQEDCDLSLLYGKTIAVIGYGSQGHAHALNAKESLGDKARVIIGLYEGSKSWAKAEAQGFKVYTAAEAAKKALEMAGKEAIDVELIVLATVTPDYYTPSAACQVQAELGADNAIAFDVNAACSGFVFALNVAKMYIETGFVKNALVIGAETLSKILDWNDRGTCVLFGDGAGAAYLEESCVPRSGRKSLSET